MSPGAEYGRAMDTKNRRRFALVLCWGFLSHMPGVCSEGSSPTQHKYVTLETDEAYMFMDEGGVAVRAEKNWACRNVGWASTADPKVFTSPDFARFRQGQIDGRTWDQWLCKAVIGAVVYSREILEAQRRMNMAPDKPDCVPWVPESGRLNWETLDYARCYLGKEVQTGRKAYDDRFTATLAWELDDETGDRNALVAKAKGTRLPFVQDGCDRELKSVFDAVVCRLERHDSFLKTAEGFFAGYSQRIDAQRGVDPIPQLTATGIAEDAKLVRRYLNRAQRDADGL